MDRLALCRLVWSASKSAVYITDNIGFTELIAGRQTDRIVGFPSSDVFQYQSGIEECTVPDRETLTPYGDIGLD